MGWFDWRRLSQIREQISDISDVQGHQLNHFWLYLTWVTEQVLSDFALYKAISIRYLLSVACRHVLPNDSHGLVRIQRLLL